MERPTTIPTPSLFTFRDHTVRVVEIDGEPWFVAADVCRALGYYMRPNGKPNVSVAIKPLDNAEKGVGKINTLGGLQKLGTVSESGLYKLIMRAHRSNPEARAFQDWVTRDVLPAIRKDGGYIRGEEKVARGEMSEDELVLRAMEVMKAKIDRLSAERDALHGEVRQPGIFCRKNSCGQDHI